jgi:membrane protein implicated in regulation of membrane protease activity
MEMYQISIIAGIVLVIIELFTFTFIFLGLGIAMLAVSVVQFFFDGLSVNRDLMIFAIVSLISIVAIRKIFKKQSDQKNLLEDDVNQY